MVRKLLYLNGLAILGVVLFHTAGTGFVAMFAWSHRYLAAGMPANAQLGSTGYYALRLIEQVVVFSLPAFLFVSGYFISVQAGRSLNIRWSAIGARIRSLGIPYLIWSLVIIFLGLLEGKRYGLVELVVMLLTGGTNPVMYFVPLLIQFYLLSPLLVSAARRNWKALLIITGVLQLLVVGSQYPQFLGLDPAFSQSLLQLVPKWLFLSRIFWFPLGIVAGFHADRLGAVLPKIKGWLLGGALLLIPVGMLEWEILFRLSGQQWLPTRETYLDTLYTALVIFGLLGLQQQVLPSFGRVSSMGSKSYGIYLTHALFIEYTARILYVVAPAILGYQILLQPILLLVGLGGPLLMMAIVDKIPIRRSYAYLFG
jgi:surface polysaccharide O-acyltransferase-like enzyme